MTMDVSRDMAPLDEYQGLADAYCTLERKYKELKATHAKCKPYIIQATEKYEAAKESIKKWCAWLEKRGYYKPRERPDPDDAAEPDRSSRNEVDERHVTSSQTTEAEAERNLSEGQESGSNDEPEVILARTIKLKRRASSGGMPPPVRIKFEPTSPSDPIELGSEDYSSPILKRQKPVRTETSDLDAHVEHIDTPRKRKTRRVQSEEEARPTTLLPATSSLSEGDVSGNHDDGAYIKAEPTETTHVEPVVTIRDFALQSRNVSGENSVLRQRSVNVPSMPNTDGPRKIIQRKRKPEVAFLSEDGDDRTSQAGGQRREPSASAHVVHRLDTLLDEPSPSRQQLPKRPTPESKLLRRPEKVAPQADKPKSTVKDPPECGVATFKRPRGLERSPPPLRPEGEPLRSRPLSRLCLDDFKINPNYMGSNYAFADTFRGREQRRCLQGCTRHECCGDAFRKAVEMGAVQSTKSDNQVLEEYLGSDYATLMSAYGPDTRKELLTKARAYAFASEHGKHRHVFERRSTPPGFWRIDMPTTQEEEQDRAKAFSLERKKVEERWREAMRGERWLFRDE